MELEKTHSKIKKAITKSQHCQRNWDLSKKIPQDDLDTILYSVTNCPSKQNHSFYKVYAITNRDIINKIHENTHGFLLPNDEWTTNSQTLANLLLVFEEVAPTEKHTNKNQNYENGSNAVKNRDVHMAVGIAAGYANLTASMLGYSTGCCACFNGEEIEKILNLSKSPTLLMGIGFGDPTRNRRLHHETNQMFPTKKKEQIETVYIE